MTSPFRESVRPTTALAGPPSVSALRPRQIALLAICWVVWYFAAGYALDALVARLAPDPTPAGLP